MKFAPDYEPPDEASRSLVYVCSLTPGDAAAVSALADHWQEHPALSPDAESPWPWFGLRWMAHRGKRPRRLNYGWWVWYSSAADRPWNVGGHLANRIAWHARMGGLASNARRYSHFDSWLAAALWMSFQVYFEHAVWVAEVGFPGAGQIGGEW